MKQLTLLYPIKDNRVLLAMKKRGVGEGFWNAVGGKVEAGETHEEAATRECMEEIEITPTEYRKVAELLFDELFLGKRGLFNIHAYICTKWTGAPKETQEMRPKWFDIDKLPLEKMWPADAVWLPTILSGKKMKGKFVLDDNNLVASKNIMYVKSFQ